MRLLPRNRIADSVPGDIVERPEVLRRYEITVEREFLGIRTQPDSNYTAYCNDCGHEVSMMTPETAAAVAGTTTRNIYRWVEEKRLHFAEPDSGKLFICFESLQQLSRSGALELRDPHPSQLPGTSR